MKQKNEQVWVEILNNQIVRIFKNDGAARFSKAWDEDRVMQVPYPDAVAAIRKNVFINCRNQCRHCGAFITWNTMHCDEKISRAKGGEISIENCQALCAACHILPGGKHDRHPRFQKVDKQ